MYFQHHYNTKQILIKGFLRIISKNIFISFSITTNYIYLYMYIIRIYSLPKEKSHLIKAALSDYTK